MELSGAEPVHSLNHRSRVFNGSLRQDAVAKIENMSGTIARTTPNPLDPRFNDLNGSEKCDGVQVPLDSHIMTKKRPGISQIRAPIHPYNICLLYTSDAADDLLCVDLGGRRIIKKKKTK